MTKINENKKFFNIQHNGIRHPIRLTGWAYTQLEAMAGRQKSAFLVDAIFTFATANGIHVDDLDEVFNAFDMNTTDVAHAAIVYAWTKNQKVALSDTN